MALNHLGELFVEFEPLPLQGGAPVIEKSPGPAFSLVVPELAEGFLEQVRCVQPFIRLEQCLQGHTSIHREVFPVSISKQGWCQSKDGVTSCIVNNLILFTIQDVTPIHDKKEIFRWSV